MTEAAELRALAEKATKGKRTVVDMRKHFRVQVRPEMSICRSYGNSLGDNDDVDFIAACDPTTILSLLDERDRLRKALTRFVYETTHLSPEDDDGSHRCRISRETLTAAREALSPSLTNEDGEVT